MTDSDTLDDDLDLLDSLLEDKSGATPPAPAGLLPRGIEQAPLSFQQERLWFLNELTGGAAAYNISSAFRLRGALDVPALRAAFCAIVARHGALRIAIHNRNGTPYQVLGSAYDPVSEEPAVEISASDEAANDALQALARREALRPFDLSAGRPLRVVIARVSAEDHALVLTLHHIVSDAWSLAILMAEVAAFYEARVRGVAAALPALSITYLDYASRQRTQSGIPERQLEYWRAALRGLPLLDLPTDRPRPPMQTFNGATIPFSISDALTKRLRSCATRERTTLFCVLMSALHVLFGRHARQSDLALGTSVAGRDLHETERLTGFFTNMLVIRGRLDADPTFSELVRAQTTVVREALDHASLPYDRLVEALKLPRDASRNPLFQIAFTLLNAPAAPPRLGSLSVEPLLSQEAARFDLEVFVREAGDGLSGVCVYNTDLFVRESVARLMTQWQVLLDDAVTHPSKAVSRLALLTAEQARSLQAQPLQRPVQQLVPVHEVFLQHARMHPDAIALRLGSDVLTYTSLERDATHLAARLIDAGVRPGEPVGLWFEPGFSMITSMLAALLSGGAYVPLDPGHPDERIQYILQDSGIAKVLTDSAHAASVPHFAGTIIVVDTREPVRAVSLPAVDISGLAYVIYTSGSTGRPKGVEVTHANVARLFNSCDALFNFDRRDVWTLFHSYAFDFSVWEIWGALTHGASLVIVPPSVARVADAFYNLVCDEGVTILSQTPSAFRHFMAAEEAHPREASVVLRYVIYGGEALDPGSLTSWIDRHGDNSPLLINMYGITETTVHVTFRRITYADCRRGAGSLIGEPLPDLCIRLLDPHGVPVPPGMTGEIHVGGAGVAQGYRGQPALTAQRFLTDADGLRIYKSGDLARSNAQGELEYRGRADAQVKLRGYRIETGEIENALKSQASIADAIVLLRGSGDAAQLVAYVREHQNAKTRSAVTSADWRPSFDMIYADTAAHEEELDIVGWTDSYDNAPLPADQMRLWRDEILDRLRATRAQRVLELGTGSGMLLLPLASQVRRYHGIDFSAEAIRRLDRKIARRGYRHVTLEQREARDQEDLPRDFDLVILSSTAQYFPDHEYFVDVVRQSLQRLVSGGTLFIGDLRHAALLRHFHASRLLHRRPGSASRAALRALLSKWVSEEKELLIDPGYFHALAETRGDIARIDIWPKEQGGPNELTTYRYDVRIVTGARNAISQAIVKRGCESVTALVAEWDGTPLVIRDLRNARLSATDAFLSWLDAEGPSDEIPEANHWNQWAETSEGLDPARTVQMLRTATSSATLHWPPADPCTSGKSALTKPGAFAVSRGDGIANWPDLSAGVGSREVASYFNVPTQSLSGQTLTARLREHLALRLPEYMIPTTFVSLTSFPLTPNGKLDVHALPAPEVLNPSEVIETSERTPTQLRLAQIWADVLQVADIALKRNFFEAGGHSLLATQVMSRVRAAFNVDLPLRCLFDRPTVAEFSALLDDTTPEHDTPPARAQIPPVPRDRLLPLSFAQQRFWFLEQVTMGDIGTYNISLALRLQGTLNRAALVYAIEAVIARHEALRTRFVLSEGVPMQRIEPAFKVQLPESDLTSLPAADAQTALDERMAQHAHARFNLEHAPPVRFALHRTAPDTHVLQITLHHAICDGWSLGVMTREFSEHYRAACAGNIAQLPPLPVQIADVAVWQRTFLAGERLAGLLSRWRERLRDAPTALDLPLLPAPRRASQPLAPVVRFEFDPEETNRLKSLADSGSATLFMVLLTGFSTLLFRYTGRWDAVVGTPIANRQREDLEGLIGCLLNTLALRIQASESVTGIELLAHVRERVLEAYELQDAPFEAVVSHLQPERSRDAHALFEVMLVLQNMSLGRLQLPELEVTPLRGEQVASSFDLTLTFVETTTSAAAGSRLEAVIEYDARKFQHRAVVSFGDQLKRLLNALALAPRRRVAELEIQSAAEREGLLTNLAGQVHPNIADHCLHDLVARQCALTPSHIAVSDGVTQLSYRELDRRANNLAHQLQRHGIGADDIVGLCAERSVAMVIGVLGILKSGAAYMPLDPGYPAERLEFLLKDSGARAICAQRALKQRIHSRCPVFDLEDALQSTAMCATAPASGATPDNLAYVMYTSGSTGTPKGVMIPHAAVVNYLSYARATYASGDEGAVPMSQSISFDGSINPLFLPLLTGRTILMLPQDDVVRHLRHALERRENLAMLDCTPSHLETLRQILRPDELPGQTQCIVIAGEALFDSTIAFWREHAPRTRLFNEYGPTEATVGSCAYLVTTETPGGGAIPIGRPHWNVRLRVLDRHMQPVPRGFPGDLYIGGAGLARGYLGRPRWTAQRFVPDPFGPGERLYRTGDRARWLENGVLDFLGRDDEQIKVRGFRIELGEIESALRQHPDVQEAAARVSTGRSGAARLVGYVTARPGRSAPLRELGAFLRHHLPDFMVPALFVELPQLPRTVNGKLDRRALPEPDSREDRSGAQARALSPLEARLAAIWSEVLRRPVTTPETDFFASGGDSLVAVRLMFRIEQEFARTLPLASLFVARTLAAQASSLREDAQPLISQGPLVRIRASAVGPAIVLVHDISGQILAYEPLAAALTTGSIYGLRSNSPETRSAAEAEIAGMACVYADAILRAELPDPLILAGHSFGAQVAGELARALAQRGRRVALLAILDAPAHVDEAASLQTPQDDLELLEYMARTLEISLEKPIGIYASDLRDLSDEARAQYVTDRVVSAGVVPAAARPETVMGMFALYKANLNSLRRFVPGAIPCPVAVWRTAAVASMYAPPDDLGWSALAGRPAQVFDAAGDHVSMLKRPHVDELAKALDTAIQRIAGT